MNVMLRPVDRTNWEQAMQLQVDDSQAGFVPAVAVSLAKVHVKPDGDDVIYLPFAIYHEYRLVGFIMHSYVEPTTDEYWINGFLIDKAQQGKGYGRAALLRMIDYIKAHSRQCRRIKLSVHFRNDKARKLYESIGFKVTDDWFRDERIMYIDV